MIYPPFGNIRKISAHIAANVAAKAYELGEPISSRIKLYVPMITLKKVTPSV